MRRHPTTENVVQFTPDEVGEMLRERLVASGIERQLIGVQINVLHPLGGDMRVHNEVPALTCILAGAKS